MTLSRAFSTAVILLMAIAFFAPAADALKAPRTVFAEEFGFST